MSKASPRYHENFTTVWYISITQGSVGTYEV